MEGIASPGVCRIRLEEPRRIGRQARVMRAIPSVVVAAMRTDWLTIRNTSIDRWERMTIRNTSSPKWPSIFLFPIHLLIFKTNFDQFVVPKRWSIGSLLVLLGTLKVQGSRNQEEPLESIMVCCRAFALGVQFRNVPRSQALQIFRSCQHSMLSSSTTPPPKPPPIPPPPPAKGPNFLHLTLLTFFFGGVAYVTLKPSSDEDEIFDKPPKFMEEFAAATQLKNSRGWFSKWKKCFYESFVDAKKNEALLLPPI